MRNTGPATTDGGTDAGDAPAGPYREVCDRLDDGLDGDDLVVTFPDGSVDTYCRLYSGREESSAIRTREALGELVSEGPTGSIRAEADSREPGGQAVNTARQVDALDGSARLYGHLDDPVFDDLPFPALSMGAPSQVRVYPFEDERLMVAERSGDVDSWTFSYLLAHPDAAEALAAAEVVCAVNWVTVPGMDEALARLADRDLGDATVLVDPGDVTGCAESSLDDLLSSLRGLSTENGLVVSVNQVEATALVDAAGANGGSLRERLGGLRENLSAGAVVVHDRDRAVAALPDGTVSVPNLDSRRVRRRTGAGDRFDGGLVRALVEGWEWEYALALGNACATYYVSEAETATPSDLASFLRDRVLEATDEGSDTSDDENRDSEGENIDFVGDNDVENDAGDDDAEE